MKLGYARKYGNDEQYDRQLDWLELQEVEEIYEDSFKANHLTDTDTDFQELLSNLRDGDELYLFSLDTLSLELKDCIKILNYPEFEQIMIVVSGMGAMYAEEWLQVLKWSETKTRKGGYVLAQVKQESLADSVRYRFFAKDPRDKEIYREVIRLLLNKRTLKQISKETGVPVETAFRMRKNLNTIKIAFLTVLIFFLTFFSLKVVEQVTNNFFLQLLSSMIFTPVVIFLTARDE